MDDLEHLLSPLTMPAEADAHREMVLRKTCGVLTRRRWWRRGQTTLAFAACFAAGLWTHHRFWPEVQTESRIVERGPITEPVERPKAAKDVDPYRNDPPDRIERWAALANGEKRLTLYRRAGDGYLAGGHELAALRCYRRVLDVGGLEVLAVNEQDSWLMMSLKMARKKEG